VDSAAKRTVNPATQLRGRVQVPGDKSISHRLLMLAALADGTSEIENLAPGEDCRATRECLEALGVRIGPRRAEPPGEAALTVTGRGPKGLARSPSVLDALNSGTTTRLLAGVLSAHAFSTSLTGDESLRRRPMRRVIEPLERMGARIESEQGRLPLTIHGGGLSGIDYSPAVPSAQVKSAVLLAGLQASGATTVRESVRTRNHTELALQAFGIEVSADAAGAVTLCGGQRPRACRARVPGDPSSAAFWAVAAAGLPGSDVEIRDVGLNPTRIAFLDVLRRAGALVDVEIANPGAAEPTGTIRVRHQSLRPIAIAPEEVPGLIDELPVLAALATFGGSISVGGAAELRVKESDRIRSLVAGLRALGASAEEAADGFSVEHRAPLTGGQADACGDHRLAMAFAIAALGATHRSEILGAGVVAVSYPGFFDALESMRT
jgi:3-phosphoshikimate 1-carboxyvinyltransferase